MSVTVIVLSVCVSIIKLAATYLVCDSKMQVCKVPYGVPNACIVWILLKMLCSPVLVSFADSKLLDFFLRVENKPVSPASSVKSSPVACFAIVPKAHAPRINNTYILYIARDTQHSIYI